MKEQYKYVKNFLSLDLVKYFSSLTHFMLQDTKEAKPDGQVPLSHSIHSQDIIAYRHLLHFLKPRMEEETGLELSPTYCYTRIYLPGCDLKRHKDRAACEISASLTMEYNYVDKNYKWPLCMENMPLLIEKGDAVIYKGCEIEHWRPIFTQPQPSWYHQVFIHYVNKNGPYKESLEEI